MQKIYANVQSDVISLFAWFQAEFFLVILGFFVALFCGIFFLLRLVHLVRFYQKKKLQQQQFFREMHYFYKERLYHLRWKEFLKQLVHYLESFVIVGSYKNIDDVFLVMWLTKKDIVAVKRALYTEYFEDIALEKKIKEILKKTS